MAKFTHEDAQQDDYYSTPIVEGTDESDEIDTSKSKDTFRINANDGDDIIYSHLDTVYGGEGNDTILDAPSFNTTSDSSYYYYGYGNISGEAGDDLITINNKSFSGDIYGGKGNDSVNILLGSANVYGGEGHDIVMGGLDSDRIYGEAGEDFLQGGGGSDHIEGGRDKDTLYGNNGNDWLSGGNGDDYISGEGGRDELIGGSGDDILNGGSHNDTITGGEGDDTVIINASTTDITGYEQLNGVITFVSGEGIDRIQGVEHFQFNDKTVALDELETTFGHIGYQRGAEVKEDYQTNLDKLSGTDGNDEIYLSGYSWNGTAPDIEAKAGNDIIFTYSGRNVTVDGGEGLDTLVTSFNSSAVGAFVETKTALMIFTANSTLKISNIEEIEFKDFVFTDNHFKSYFADLKLAADTILGSHANDTLGGTLLDDNFYSGTGYDSIDGNDGNDTLIFNFETSQVTKFTQQNNQVKIFAGSSEYTIKNIETYQFADKIIDVNDVSDVFYRVNTADQTFDGSGANDDLKGGLGNDVLNGYGGDDTLFGDSGSDEINGGDGEDTAVFNQSSEEVSSYTNEDGTVILNLGDYSYYYGNKDTISDVEHFQFSDKSVAFEDLDEIFLTVNTADQTFTAGNVTEEITGGLGNDTVIFNFSSEEVETYSSSSYYYSNSGRTITHNGQTYTLKSIENFQFSNKTLTNNNINTEFSSISTDNQYLSGNYNNDDILSGGFGNDTIYGYGGDDTLSGGDGNDRIEGDEGNDTISGGAGDDRIYTEDSYNSDYSTETGNNMVDAGDGDDHIYIYSDGGTNTIDGGAGDDKVYFDYKVSDVTKLTITDSKVTLETESLITTTSNVEHFIFDNDTVEHSQLTTFFKNVYVQEHHDQPNPNPEPISNLIEGTDASEVIEGTDADDVINAGSGIDVITAGAGDDLINDAEIGEVIDGGTGVDTVKFNIDATSIIAAVRSINGVVKLVTDNGTASLTNVENILFSTDNLTSLASVIEDKNSDKPAFKSFVNGETIDATPEAYTGLVDFLEYQLLGDVNANVVTGSSSNDFFNLLDGDDAANGGAGRDVLDGGTGSNFLTGGADADTFFLDGRGGTTTWSTITDFDGDSVNIWGWEEGVSQLIQSVDSAGAEGFKGATFHFDLNNDGNIDTSITFSGLTTAQVPGSSAQEVAGNGYLLFA